MVGLQFTVLLAYIDVFAWGAMWTGILCFASVAFSIVGGIPMAMAVLSRHELVRRPVAFLTWVFRGTPLLLQLYMIYFGLPKVGLYLSPITSGILGLSLHYSVYNADVIRAGIAAIDTGQHEASRSLGLSRLQTMRKVIIPQALRNVTPALGNNFIALLKESALVSIITVPELTLSAQLGISETFRPFEFYLAAGAVYYAINYLLEVGLKRVEMKAALSR
jgi:polar amino acid transport system permease protein